MALLCLKEKECKIKLNAGNLCGQSRKWWRGNPRREEECGGWDEGLSSIEADPVCKIEHLLTGRGTLKISVSYLLSTDDLGTLSGRRVIIMIHSQQPELFYHFVPKLLPV